MKPVDDGDRSVPPVKAAKAKLRPGATERPEGAGLFVFAERENLMLDRNFHSEWVTR